MFTDAIEAICQELANWKEEKRTKKTNPKLAGKLQELKAERKLVRVQVKAVKVAAKENAAIKPLIEEVNLAVDAAIKETRNHYSNKHGLYWPNYLENERSAKLAWAGTNSRKLANALLRVWRENHSLQPNLEQWRKHHFHLLRYERGFHQSLNQTRRDLYRNFVSQLAKTYSICGIEEFDLRKFTRKDAAKDTPPDLVKWHRTVANLSSLTTLIKQRILTDKLPAHDTTRKCHNCGLVEEWNSAAEVWHRCSNCQSRWDQDYNSAQNLLVLLYESYDKQKELSARESEHPGQGSSTDEVTTS